MLTVRVCRGMSPSEVECCFKQILNGVSYLHSQGVAHRDIKPENLFFDTKGHLKVGLIPSFFVASIIQIFLQIGDYGASTVYRLPWEATVHMSTGLCGSEPYIAPEQFIGKREPTSLAFETSQPDILCLIPVNLTISSFANRLETFKPMTRDWSISGPAESSTTVFTFRNSHGGLLNLPQTPFTKPTLRHVQAKIQQSLLVPRQLITLIPELAGHCFARCLSQIRS